MFSLIVTLISIALVAALALASLYYGGPVFNQGAARAHAAKIAAQGQQIQGAAELYKADTGEYPISLAELVAQDYLKSIPVAAAQEQVLINNALAATSWVMVAPKTPVFALTGVTEAVCKAINLGSYGVEGILKTARESNRVQCYGTDLSNLMIVQAKAPSDLVVASSNPAAVIQVGTVLAAPVPAADSTDTSNAGWLVAPGTGTPVVTPPATPQVSYFDDKNGSLATLTMPSTPVGQTSAGYAVVVKNSGTVAITFAAAGATVPAPFAETSDTCSSATLAPNGTCTVTVTFTPAAASSYTGSSYSLTLSSSTGSLASLPISGEGVSLGETLLFTLPAGSALSLNAQSQYAYNKLDWGTFGNFGFDAGSATPAVTVTNTGIVPVSFTLPAALPGYFTGSCVSGTTGTIPAGQSCDLRTKGFISDIDSQADAQYVNAPALAGGYSIAFTPAGQTAVSKDFLVEYRDQYKFYENRYCWQTGGNPDCMTNPD